jgi:hypothetical protein
MLGAARDAGFEHYFRLERRGFRNRMRSPNGRMIGAVTPQINKLLHQGVKPLVSVHL